MSGIQQGSLKTITDSKLAAFDVGSQRKSRFQKAREEGEKRKRREVEEAERLYAGFVASFYLLRASFFLLSYFFVVFMSGRWLVTITHGYVFILPKVIIRICVTLNLKTFVQTW